jgi:hypothetical protein
MNPDIDGALKLTDMAPACCFDQKLMVINLGNRPPQSSKWVYVLTPGAGKDKLLNDTPGAED